MGLLSQREKGAIDRRQSLEGVPVFHESVTQVEDEESITTIKMIVPKGHTFFDRFRPPAMERSYELDEFGTFIVHQIDGERTVLDIVIVFEQRYGMNHREAELGVVAFLKMLMKREVLSVVVK